jgi:hypothetical protein
MPSWCPAAIVTDAAGKKQDSHRPDSTAHHRGRAGISQDDKTQITKARRSVKVISGAYAMKTTPERSSRRRQRH